MSAAPSASVLVLLYQRSKYFSTCGSKIDAEPASARRDEVGKEVRLRVLKTRDFVAATRDAGGAVEAKELVAPKVQEVRQHVQHRCELREDQYLHHASAFVSIRQHTSAYVQGEEVREPEQHLQHLQHSRQLRQVEHFLASIRQHTSAYVNKRQHTPA